MPLIIAVILAVILIIVLMIHFSKAKCTHCKKRNSTQISREMIRTDEIFFKEKEMIKEYNNKSKFRTNVAMRTAANQYLNPPDKVTTREIMVPGKRIWYKVGYKCNNCGKTFYRIEYVDEKATIIK